MAQSGIPESFPSIKHTWLDKLQMSQAPPTATSAFATAGRSLPLAQHPPLLTPLPTMAISMMISTALLWFWTELTLLDNDDDDDNNFHIGKLI